MSKLARKRKPSTHVQIVQHFITVSSVASKTLGGHGTILPALPKTSTCVTMQITVG